LKELPVAGAGRAKPDCQMGRFRHTASVMNQRAGRQAGADRTGKGARVTAVGGVAMGGERARR
jgi:hypothetical protein